MRCVERLDRMSTVPRRRRVGHIDVCLRDPPAAGTATFPTKIDAWLVLIIVIGFLVAFAGAVAAWRTAISPRRSSRGGRPYGHGRRSRSRAHLPDMPSIRMASWFPPASSLGASRTRW